MASLTGTPSYPVASQDPRTSAPVRCRWRVTGQVQGVGFRPFVHQLAEKLGITGHVRNDAAGVTIETQALPGILDQFESRLQSDAPPMAVIRQIRRTPVMPRDDERDFQILHSTRLAPPAAGVTPDAAVCDDCLADIQNARQPRRHGYALTNCTACGPRYSILRAIPYDRANTTMSAFQMCPACRDEYIDPHNRRFHAQPTACHACGPRVELIDPSANPLPGNPIAESARRLQAGQIIAIKGIGGYHIAVRADDESAVARLRRLKNRPAKPLAVMVANLQQAGHLIELSDQAIRLLRSPAAPVVLARRRLDAPIAPSVAPASHRLGVMLAYTPLHHLLFNAIGSAIPALVMTSANDQDQPIVHDDNVAMAELAGLCDALLRHDRPIERPVDDSVVIDAFPQPVVIRRARGYAPGGISIPAPPAMQGLALGAELKNTVAVLRGGEAVCSQHLGDLTHSATYRHFMRAVEDLLALFESRPAWVAHDLHPMYLSSAYARTLAQRWNVPLIAVQHHHAHAAAVLAEHGMTDPALAIVCDGTGYGTDGTIWGGELLLANLAGFRRLRHLQPLRLPGGDAAARQPWRSALALLFNLLGNDFADHPAAVRLADHEQRAFVAAMIVAKTACAISSSAGRVFDAVAALLGVCRENRFDAEAPMALEAVACATADSLDIREEIAAGAPPTGALDVAPLIRRLLMEQARGVPTGVLAGTFHDGFAALWARAARAAAATTGLKTVALSGGVMCNTRLVEALSARLEEAGLRVLCHRAAPPNDGGIALGQLAVAAARMQRGPYQHGSE